MKIKDLKKEIQERNINELVEIRDFINKIIRYELIGRGVLE